MDALTQKQIDALAALMAQRKRRLEDEIREGLARAGHEPYADALSGTADAGDESVANLLRDVAHAEVARDIDELRDIVAAERRIAAGSYGTCIDCGAPIGHRRLEVYPAAKRCRPCQEIHEKGRGAAPSL
ncbi:MAG: TraR/DksA family transcriptional regulator [Burkholderiales bacterium]|nr:TraR/DksA family transcriptional regulator [Burkholderiales bacterium]